MPAGSGLLPLAKTGWLTALGRDMWILGSHPVFMLNMLAYCPVQGAFGSYIFWGPKVGICMPYKDSPCIAGQVQRCVRMKDDDDDSLLALDGLLFCSGMVQL